MRYSRPPGPQQQTSTYHRAHRIRDHLPPLWSILVAAAVTVAVEEVAVATDLRSISHLRRVSATIVAATSFHHYYRCHYRCHYRCRCHRHYRRYCRRHRHYPSLLPSPSPLPSLLPSPLPLPLPLLSPLSPGFGITSSHGCCIPPASPVSPYVRIPV